MTSSVGGLRDRFRAQMRDEVKELALRQLADGGPQALSISAIAKSLGVSGPALYRYFSSRDELLTELILDAYYDLTAALQGTEPAHLIAGYRAWALAQPHRYRLLFAAPLPGYDAHDERLVAAAQQAMALVLSVTPAGPTPDPLLAAQLSAWAPSQIEPAVAMAAITLWSRVHGLVSLEIEGNFASMGLTADSFYDALLTGER